MSSNVIVLGNVHGLDNRSTGFLNSIRALAAVIEPLQTVLANIGKTEQRCLLQIIACRLEGGSWLPASESLVRAPFLIGMGFDEIQRGYEVLLDGGVIERMDLRKDRNGNVVEMGFRWPAFERLMEQGDEIAKGPQLTDPQGRSLR